MTTTAPGRAGLAGPRQWLPRWIAGYRRADLPGDLMAGVIVAIMLVPQSMAYAMLAGLPPQVGLYASILPLLVYPLLGTSRVLAVGPVAMVSLLVAAGVSKLATPGAPEYVALALILALLVGLVQLGMGLLRVGFLVNFLSHPVISGFTSAAALVIGFSQLRHLIGLPLARTGRLHELLLEAGRRLDEANPATLGIGLGSIAVLLLFGSGLDRLLAAWGVRAGARTPICRAGPLVVVVAGTGLVGGLGLASSAGVAIVGEIPTGLPRPTLPALDPALWTALVPTALAISFVGFMESVSVARALASKRRQKVDPDRELVGLGAANLAAAFTGGYPVTGGFSRSVVNYSAGANTGLASMITAVLMALSVVFLTPLLFHLPQAVLAAIIVVAVARLVDVDTLRHVLRYSFGDAAALLITFFTVLAAGIETGILVGAASAVVIYLWRTSRPHIAIVGRLDDTEHFRNVLRHDVRTCAKVLALRVDESLYFANTRYLEGQILGAVAERPEVEHLILICSAVSFIDASALETLEGLVDELHDAGVQLCMAEVKGPVMDRLEEIGFIDRLGRENVHLSTFEAWRALGCTA